MPTLRHWLAPGSPDDARAAIQPAIVARLMGAGALRGRCLNAGSGEGLFTPMLERAPGITAVVDVDIALRPLRTGAGAPHFRVRGDLQRLPFSTASFDACLCTEVLEHVPDDGQAVRELARVLRPGARIVISVPCPPAPYDAAHVRDGYGLEQLSELLHAGGFTVERHAWAFHLIMRGVMAAWAVRPQSRIGRRLMPKGLFRAAGWLDAAFPAGRPWDLIVVARRNG